MAIQMRQQLRAELRRRYEQLKTIPGPRWTSVQGQLFLRDLHTFVASHGQRQVAAAMGITTQGLSQMLARHDPDQLLTLMRTVRTLADLDVAYAQVLKWRSMGKVVRRHHESYRRVFDALDEMLILYPPATIARLSGIRAQELRRFMIAPTATTYDDISLLMLLEVYGNGTALTGPGRRAFLTQLEETLASHQLVDVAHVLRVPARVVRTWMVEQAHGQHSSEPADP